MILLVDTQIALWTTQAPEKLKTSTMAIILDPGHKLVLSHASLWETSIKHSKGKLALVNGLDGFIKSLSNFGFNFLPITIDHIRRQNTLPFHHKDPFDRMLVSQALVEDLPLLSTDSKLRDYGVRLLI